MIVKTKDHRSFLFERDINGSLWLFLGTAEGIVEEFACEIGKPLKVEFRKVNPITCEPEQEISLMVSATAVTEVVEINEDALT